MEIREEKRDKYYVVSLVGRLDASTAGDFEEKLIAAIDNGETSVIVDFVELDYISSSGLRVLLVGAKKLKSMNGMIGLCNLKSHIKEVFEIAGFLPVFNVFDTLEEALNS